ncbi:MAG: PEP/pyruvate-binding domain-containing protein, partial [Chloroflexota bacterium]
MPLSNLSSDRVLNIYLTLSEYPVLSARIRHIMRKQIFASGVITREAFDAEARQKAILSQFREGLSDPYGEEASEIWEERLRRVRDHLTDFYFAYNLPYEDFEHIVRQAVSERGETPDVITFNPELAPQDMLFQQAEDIENLPAAKRKKYEARLQEIKAVLIRTMISDQLSYLNIARKWFTVEDLKYIYHRKIGYGKIGGKSAGMLLAYRILREAAPPEVRESIRIPVSYFLASDLYYVFIANNELIHWSDQKYKSEARMRSEYPKIVKDFVSGEFPEDIIERLQDILAEAGKRPLIVRSSSLLEDNFGTSFAGKYNSYFVPNQGTPEENLPALTEAIARVYASCVNPNALLYRHAKGLVEYDERIAVLLQFVEGEQLDHYFMPPAAGVAFSRNLYRWSPQIRKEDGFVRLVWGLGTRAV